MSWKVPQDRIICIFTQLACCSCILFPLCVSHEGKHISYCPYISVSQLDSYCPWSLPRILPKAHGCWRAQLAAVLQSREAPHWKSRNVGDAPMPQQVCWSRTWKTRGSRRCFHIRLTWDPWRQQTFCYRISMTLWVKLPNPFPFVTLFRPIQACSVWSSTLIRTCPSIPKRSWKCTRARRGMRCPPTFTLSQTPPIGVWCKVSPSAFQGSVFTCSLVGNFAGAPSCSKPWWSCGLVITGAGEGAVHQGL